MNKDNLIKLLKNSAINLAFVNSCFDMYNRTIKLIDNDNLSFFEKYRDYFVITQKSMFDIGVLYLEKAYDVDRFGKRKDTTGISKAINLLESHINLLSDSHDNISKYQKRFNVCFDDIDPSEFISSSKNWLTNNSDIIEKLRDARNQMSHPKEAVLLNQLFPIIKQQVSNDVLNILIEFAIDFYQKALVILGETPIADRYLYRDDIERLVKDSGIEPYPKII